MNLIDTRFKGYVTFYKTQTRQSDITNYLYTYKSDNESTKCDLFNKGFALLGSQASEDIMFTTLKTENIIIHG